MSNVINAVNEAIREASNGAVPEAIKLDVTPTRIRKVNTDPSLDDYMDKLIASFREHEKEMNHRGAVGFEGFPFTGTLDGHHSLWCTLVGPNMSGLKWEPREDALYASRMPSEMDCRPYPVTAKLLDLMEKQMHEKKRKVGADPVVSVFIYETGIRSWTIMVPTGPHSAKSEFRYDKVFKYIPEYKVVLALATKEEHAEAEKRMRAAGLWVDSDAK